MTSEGKVRAARAALLIEHSPDDDAEVASKMGVDESLVSRWRSGTRGPTVAQVERLEALYGQRRPTAAPKRERVEDEDPDEDNNARLRRFIREGIRELEHNHDLSGVKRAEALKKLVDAQVALDKSTGENAITQQRIVAHPTFKRIVKKIVDAISSDPVILAKVLEAIDPVRG